MAMQAQSDFSVFTQMPPICKAMLDAKAKSGKTFEAIGKDIGRSEVYVAAMCYGQAKPAAEDLEGLSKSLSIPKEQLTDALGQGFYPQRGLGSMPPTDPLLYRLYEMILVFGQPIKKFGDGICSAINMTVDVDKVEDPAGERVKITFNGKWLPHLRF